jgi:hypothetical protein
MLPLNSEQKALGLSQIHLQERRNFSHGFQDSNDIQFLVEMFLSVTINLISDENPLTIVLSEDSSIAENPRKDGIDMSLIQFLSRCI